MTFGGYSQSFNLIRQHMDAGDYARARAIYLGEAEDVGISNFVSTDDKFLRNVELGVMLLDERNPDQARLAFDAAEGELTERDQGERKAGFLGSIGKRAGALTATAIGRRGLAPYQPADYERILQLNYLTLGYLLEGDRSAFNVSRRATQEQLLAREAFLQELAKVEQELDDAPSREGAVSARDGFYGEFAQFNSIADRVPSAYVNPLGFYVTALVYEIDAARRPNFTGNARASYEKALELTPQSNYLRGAIQDTSGSLPSEGSRLHVLVGEGFAPTRQLLEYGLDYQSRVIPVKVPVLVPHASSIDRFEIRNQSGRVLGEMEPFADIEAMMMRSQKDRLPMVWAEVFFSIARSALLTEAAGDSSWAGLTLGMAEGLQSPDMRSWSSLPRRFHMARFDADPSVTSIEIRALDEDGRLVTTRTAPVNWHDGHAIVYGRAVSGGLNAGGPTTLWQ